jgi:hypothetical protein
MANLERMIRRELIEERAEENYKLSISPGYMATLRQMVDEITGKDSTLDEEINSKLFSLPALKKSARESAEGAFYSMAEMSYTMDSVMESIKGIFDDEEMAKLKAAEAPYLSSLKLMDKYIAGLTDVAKAKGLEAALSQESRDDVYRQMFPTAGEYIAFHKGLNEGISQYASSLLSMIQKADEDKISVMQKCFLKLSEATKNVLAVKAEQDAIRIYGGK